MPDRQRQAGGPGAGTSLREGVGQVLILIWALGIFYHFYHSQGFFKLVVDIVKSGL